MFQWLQPSGARTVAQDIVNFGATMAMPDPIGAFGRTVAIAKSAEGFGGVLGRYWGGTSLDRAHRFL